MSKSKPLLQTNSNFMAEIEKLVKDRKLQYIDAVIVWCESNGLEIEFAGDLIRKTPVLKAKIQVEAEDLNFMKKTARLPI